jgi:carbon-monoxide dehydrogenase medium subunit
MIYRSFNIESRDEEEHIVKPPPFAYSRPSTLAEALDLLAGDEGALPLAGGQSLVPMLNMRLARPTTIVDIGQVSELLGVQNETGSVTVGARVTHHNLARLSALHAVKALPRAVAEIGFPAIRHRGTVGGSLAHADPAAELTTLLVAIDATVVLASTAGERRLRLDDFLLGYYSTSRRPDELITGVTIPTPPGLATGFAEFSRRPGDFALALCAVATWRQEGGGQAARVVIGGLDVRPRRITSLEDSLVRQPPTEAFEAATPELLATFTSPATDIHGSADFRLQVGSEMVRRALSQVAA